MADKKHIRQTINGLQKVKTWQLIALLILAGFLAATFLRLNNIGMVQRRDAVISADKVGDEQITIQRLYDLQRYVSAHMNTNLSGGVSLENSYKRDYQKAIKTASSDGNPNGNIYKKAQQVCAPQFSAYSTAYLQCTLNELRKYPSADKLISTVRLPDANAYIHNYISPLWSPDFAGWAVVVCFLLALLIIVRIVTLTVLRLMLRHHYKAV